MIGFMVGGVRCFEVRARLKPSVPNMSTILRNRRLQPRTMKAKDIKARLKPSVPNMPTILWNRRLQPRTKETKTRLNSLVLRMYIKSISKKG